MCHVGRRNALLKRRQAAHSQEHCPLCCLLSPGVPAVGESDSRLLSVQNPSGHGGSWRPAGSQNLVLRKAISFHGVFFLCRKERAETAGYLSCTFVVVGKMSSVGTSVSYRDMWQGKDVF